MHLLGRGYNKYNTGRTQTDMNYPISNNPIITLCRYACKKVQKLLNARHDYCEHSSLLSTVHIKTMNIETNKPDNHPSLHYYHLLLMH